MVRFNPNHAPSVQFQTLVHEYAHVLLGHLGPIDSDTPEQKWDPETRKRTRLPREIQELEAESVAHIVCMSFGVYGNSAEYLRNYVGKTLDNHNTWPADMSITKVSQTASSIMKLLGDYQDIPVRKSIRSVHIREDQNAQRPLDFGHQRSRPKTPAWQLFTPPQKSLRRAPQ